MGAFLSALCFALGDMAVRPRRTNTIITNDIIDLSIILPLFRPSEYYARNTPQPEHIRY
jgi:hypothetical protein